MNDLYENLIKAKKQGYWSANVNKEKKIITHTLYYKVKSIKNIIYWEEPSIEVPILEFETPINVSYYDFSYPIKVYLEPFNAKLKGCVRFKDDTRVEGLEEFKKIVLDKVIETHNLFEINLGIY